jgi:hypothetical protein
MRGDCLSLYCWYSFLEMHDEFETLVLFAMYIATQIRLFALKTQTTRHI